MKSTKTHQVLQVLKALLYSILIFGMFSLFFFKVFNAPLISLPFCVLLLSFLMVQGYKNIFYVHIYVCSLLLLCIIVSLQLWHSKSSQLRTGEGILCLFSSLSYLLGIGLSWLILKKKKVVATFLVAAFCLSYIGCHVFVVRIYNKRATDFITGFTQTPIGEGVFFDDSVLYPKSVTDNWWLCFDFKIIYYVKDKYKMDSIRDYAERTFYNREYEKYYNEFKELLQKNADEKGYGIGTLVDSSKEIKGIFDKIAEDSLR